MLSGEYQIITNAFFLRIVSMRHSVLLIMPLKSGERPGYNLKSDDLEGRYVIAQSQQQISCATTVWYRLVLLSPYICTR